MTLKVNLLVDHHEALIKYFSISRIPFSQKIIHKRVETLLGRDIIGPSSVLPWCPLLFHQKHSLHRLLLPPNICPLKSGHASTTNQFHHIDRGTYKFSFRFLSKQRWR